MWIPDEFECKIVEELRNECSCDTWSQRDFDTLWVLRLAKKRRKHAIVKGNEILLK